MFLKKLSFLARVSAHHAHTGEGRIIHIPFIGKTAIFTSTLHFARKKSGESGKKKAEGEKEKKSKHEKAHIVVK